MNVSSRPAERGMEDLLIHPTKPPATAILQNSFVITANTIPVANLAFGWSFFLTSAEK